MPYTTDKKLGVGVDPVTVDWSKLERNTNVNPKTIPVGSVAYYVKKRHNRYSVDYGIVYEHYHDCVLLQRVMFRDRRMVVSEFSDKPIPFKDFPHQTEWRKLPKGWNWDTQLFSYVTQELTEVEKSVVIRIDEPDTIISAYQSGVLVNVRDVPYEKIDAVIEGKFGYKLIRKSMESERIIDPNRPIDTVGVEWFQCFSTYADAKAACDKYEADLQNQANMTDLEWTISLINHDVDRWAALNGVSDENCERARSFLLGLKDIENVETRVISEGLQWKYWKKTRWATVPIE